MPYGAIVGGIGIASSIGGSRSQARQARKLGRAQARLERETTAEELRRMDRDFAQLRGRAEATVFASGLEMSGSSEAYMEDMESEFAKQRDWTERAGELRADVARRGGQATAGQIRAGGIQGILSGIGMIGQSQNWWS